MLRVAFAGTFAASLEPRVRAHLRTPCDVVLTDEAGVVPRMPDLDVVVTCHGRACSAISARA